MTSNRYFFLVLAIAAAFVSTGALKAQNALSLNPGLTWNPERFAYYVPCDSSEVRRVYLSNSGADQIELDTVLIQGLDSPEFSVDDNQMHYLPLQDRLPWPMDNRDSFWIDFRFRPNLSKGYSLRRAFVLALGKDINQKKYVDTLWLDGVVRHAYLSGPINYDFGIVGFGSAKDTTLMLMNLGDTDFVIAKFNLREGQDFKITSGPKLGDRVKPGDRAVAYIRYSASAANGRSFDTLVAEGLHPVCESLSIPVSGLSASAFVSNDPNDAAKNVITVFPNPAAGETTISANARQMRVEVFDVLGRLVAKSVSTDGVWKWDCSIGGSPALIGSYLLRIDGIGESGDAFASSARLLIER